LIELAIRLCNTSTESDCNPVFGFNDYVRKMTSTFPFLAHVIRMPCSAQTKLSVENNAIVKNNFQLLTVILYTFNCCANLGNWANKAN
jgi:hypothetical protein